MNRNFGTSQIFFLIICWKHFFVVNSTELFNSQYSRWIWESVGNIALLLRRLLCIYDVLGEYGQLFYKNTNSLISAYLVQTVTA